jgi:periplasmic divalent cation tolerance protein
MADIVVLITTGSQEEAKKLGHILVEEGLVACVNLVPKIQSIFSWEGKVVEEQECLLILKTVDDVFHSLEATVKAHHSYEVPEIIALPIVKGSASYLSWIREMTNPAARSKT